MDMQKLRNEFIEFAKEKYGMDIKAEPSDSPDTFETIFSCAVPENKFVIPFGNYKIVAEIDDRHQSEIPPEMIISIYDKDDRIVQDVCLVRPHYEFDRKTMEWKTDNDFVDCLVWSDSDDEDYTHKHVIGVYKEAE